MYFLLRLKKDRFPDLKANRAKKLQFPVEYLFNQMMNNILNNKCVLVLIIHIVYNFVIIVKLYQPFLIPEIKKLLLVLLLWLKKQIRI